VSGPEGVNVGRLGAALVVAFDLLAVLYGGAGFVLYVISDEFVDTFVSEPAGPADPGRS
jgi:hypothetical protein